MKQGNQFWYGIKIKDEGEYIDISTVEKVVFNFDEISYTYDSTGEDNKNVEYVEEENLFKIYLTQEMTKKLEDDVKIDCRVKFKNEEILGSAIKEDYIFDSLNTEVL